MLELKNVKKIYTTKAGDTAALDGLSVTLPDSGLIFVTGKSGSGKTTFLNVVGALDGFDDGEIIIDGKNFANFTAKEASSYRNTFVGFIFQEYNLLPNYTVSKNIKIANELQGRETSDEEVENLLNLVGLEGLANRHPNQLSGGQKQRVAIARALVKKPKIIMADEPTGALDQATGVQIMETLKKLSKTNLVLVVSHDLEIAERFADRILRLVDGKLVEDVTLSDKEITANVISDDGSITVKSGAQLTDTETASLVNAIREKKKINLVESLTVRARKKTAPIKAVHPETPAPFVNSKMKLKSSMGLGVNSLKAKPFRLIITIILSVFAFALFGIFDTVASFNNTKATANLLRSGDYASITAQSQYANEFGTSDVRLSQSDIDKINQTTGQNFRGLYEIVDNFNRGIYTHSNIEEIDPNVSEGSQYYLLTLTDFVEFKKDEMTRDGEVGSIIDANGYNLKMLYGKYPTLPDLQPEEKLTNVNIAISSYTAEAIMRCLQLGQTSKLPSGTSSINSIGELIGEQISIYDRYDEITYTISGIIDCGAIPEKYDELKTAIPNEKNYALSQDFMTFINSGLHLKVFVPEGFVSFWRTENQRELRYFSDPKNSIMKLGDVALGDSKYNVANAFYNVKDFTYDKVILFEPSSSANVNIGRKDVIINASDIQHYYKAEKNKLSNLEKTTFSNYVNALANPDPSITAIQRKETLNELYELLKSADTSFELEKTVNMSVTNAQTETTSTFDCNIVGIYFLTDCDISKPNGHSGAIISYPLMVNDTFMNTIGVYNQQGIYSKMISPVNTGYFDANNLAEMLNNENGVKLSWYQNTILDTIDANRQQVQQFSNLFLYVSLALAVFSVFMLFNYISTSIVARRQSIGVLRALGSNSKDIFRIFITESLIISLINGVLACGVAAIGCIFVNSYIQSVMGLSISFALYGVRQIIITLLASFVTGILASLIPIFKICKEKPVDLIRRP